MAATITDIGGRYRRYVETSAADTALTMTVNPGVPFRVLDALTSYSAAPTQTGVVHALDSGAGAGYDGTLSTGSANARYTAYQPTRLTLGGDDAFTVTAPAAGGVITGSISCYIELL